MGCFPSGVAEYFGDLNVPCLKKKPGSWQWASLLKSASSFFFSFLPVMRHQGHKILMSTLPDFQSVRYASHVVK